MNKQFYIEWGNDDILDIIKKAWKFILTGKIALSLKDDEMEKIYKEYRYQKDLQTIF